MTFDLRVFDDDDDDDDDDNDDVCLVVGGHSSVKLREHKIYSTGLNIYIIYCTNSRRCKRHSAGRASTLACTKL